MITWIAKEGTSKFTFEAKDLNEALGVCEMYNAVLIGKQK